MKCGQCKRELRVGAEQVGIDYNGMPVFHRFGYCDACRFKFDLDLAPKKKKHSTLSTIACALSGVSFIFPMIFIVGYLLALAGFILAAIDFATKKSDEKHGGSWFAIVVFIIYSIALVFLLG